MFVPFLKKTRSIGLVTLVLGCTPSALLADYQGSHNAQVNSGYTTNPNGSYTKSSYNDAGSSYSKSSYNNTATPSYDANSVNNPNVNKNNYPTNTKADSFGNGMEKLPNTSYNAPRNGVVASGKTDQELSKEIHEHLNSGWFSKGYDQVVITVNNGNVSLEGVVKTRDDKDRVEKEVRNIHGVNSLNSQIVIQDPNSKNPKDAKQFPQDVSGTSTDEQLNKKIRDNVSRGWLWNSYKEVTLNTNNGNVTLEGKVNSASDQQKLIDEVQKVEGVKSVKSNLTIQNR